MGSFRGLPPSPIPLKERSYEITRGLLGKYRLERTEEEENKSLLVVGYASLSRDILLQMIQFLVQGQQDSRESQTLSFMQMPWYGFSYTSVARF
jgi:hypothetical protein